MAQYIKLLRDSNDSHKFAGLLLASKVLETGEAVQGAVFDAVGLPFLIRLLRSDRTSDKNSKAYCNLGLDIILSLMEDARVARECSGLLSEFVHFATTDDYCSAGLHCLNNLLSVPNIEDKLDAKDCADGCLALLRADYLTKEDSAEAKSSAELTTRQEQLMQCIHTLLIYALRSPDESLMNEIVPSIASMFAEQHDKRKLRWLTMLTHIVTNPMLKQDILKGTVDDNIPLWIHFVRAGCIAILTSKGLHFYHPQVFVVLNSLLVLAGEGLLTAPAPSGVISMISEKQQDAVSKTDVLLIFQVAISVQMDLLTLAPPPSLAGDSKSPAVPTHDPESQQSLYENLAVCFEIVEKYLNLLVADTDEKIGVKRLAQSSPDTLIMFKTRLDDVKESIFSWLDNFMSSSSSNTATSRWNANLCAGCMRLLGLWLLLDLDAAMFDRFCQVLSFLLQTTKSLAANDPLLFLAPFLVAVLDTKTIDSEFVVDRTEELCGTLVRAGCVERCVSWLGMMSDSMEMLDQVECVLRLLAVCLLYHEHLTLNDAVLVPLSADQMQIAECNEKKKNVTSRCVEHLYVEDLWKQWDSHSVSVMKQLYSLAESLFAVSASHSGDIADTLINILQVGLGICAKRLSLANYKTNEIDFERYFIKAALLQLAAHAILGMDADKVVLSAIVTYTSISIEKATEWMKTVDTKYHSLFSPIIALNCSDLPPFSSHTLTMCDQWFSVLSKFDRSLLREACESNAHRIAERFPSLKLL